MSVKVLGVKQAGERMQGFEPPVRDRARENGVCVGGAPEATRIEQWFFNQRGTQEPDIIQECGDPVVRNGQVMAIATADSAAGWADLASWGRGKSFEDGAGG
ncbi:uncharacterized protein N7484_009604 [Penicillium longicatenatum]|uniref:uncharacterized protein n=1 Tax=Penicillium longicatenatum TaxID=1561947 RepID=UPI002546B559|nr:uncharacterized protein N7484_009604 [Penicillium longicatenatum]KAJ5636291.1 hypothetical protein N7484_009604 [Penicillium longicatenatum]